MSSLHVDSVLKNFWNKQVLTDVFIQCNKGEIIGLLGRNGSGKTTLLKIIFGSLRADNKFIKIASKRLLGLYDARKLINFLPQNGFLPNHLSVRNIISLFCDKENAEIIRSVPCIQALVGKMSKQLSGGEKRLLEIYLIIFSDAEFILIDEPFNGVAPVYKEDIKNLIREQSKNKGFIITDHDYHNIMDVSTRMILLHDGGTKEINHISDLEYWGYLPRK
ncbi:MAG: ATP-binding cassette domain-containing protein [Bacteroidales bacterium]|jgi:ABC-type multidrug transport system ATPase subunit|nr:ATP-binding cassette domain-containing protein [Bacteroidales bacterium]